MSLETELKKIGNNLQQLTDAVVTLTAELQTLKGLTASATTGQPVQIAEKQSGDSIDSSRTEAGSVVTETTVVVQQGSGTDTEGASGTTDTSGAMDMATANAELNVINQAIGDAGVAIRNLLASKNAITLAQIPPENYASFVDEARALIPANQQ